MKGGYILITGKTTRESVWAFERNAPSQGGWIASQNGPEQVTAAEFARRIREGETGLATESTENTEESPREECFESMQLLCVLCGLCGKYLLRITTRLATCRRFT